MEEELFVLNCRYGYFPDYRITKSGKVYSYRQGKFLKPISPALDTSGYPIVRLRTPKGSERSYRTMAIHRLVADMFIPNPNNLECINHKDENKQNNSISNLEWCTKAYNNTYGDKAIKIGYKLRFINKKRKSINQLKDGKVINTYMSIREAARQMGNAKKDANICAAIKHKGIAYGYQWEYANECDNSISRDNQQPSTPLTKCEGSETRY